MKAEKRLGGPGTGVKEAWQQSPSPTLLYSSVLDPSSHNNKDCKSMETRNLH